MTQLDAASARRYWDDAADEWDNFVENLDHYRIEFHGPALLEACGEVAGLTVLDLGCGQGWFTRKLAGRGAKTIGVEWSPRLVSHARRREGATGLGCKYDVLDAALIGERYPRGTFDLVTGCMSVMDMPDVPRVLAGTRAVLKPGGRCVFSVPNPVTDAPYREWERDAHGEKTSLKLDRYFEATPELMHWDMKRLPRHFKTVQYRYTLEQWSDMIATAGFVIARLREPRPTPEAIARRPDLGDAARMPYFLIFELR